MIKVSIIIPVYNVQGYIERCINSVLNQTYRNIEVVIVDDCTPDNSIQVLREAIQQSEKSQDLEFKFMAHSHNLGLSVSRNTGIKASTGDYIYLLDSDDELPLTSIENLVSLAVKYHGVEIVQGSTWCNNPSVAAWVSIKDKGFPEYSEEKEWISKQFINIDYTADCIPVTAWNRLYHKNLFSEKNMFFKEGIIHEDEHWRLIYGPRIQSIAFCFETTYNYFVRQASITTSKKTDNRRTVSMMKIYEEYLPYVAHYTLDDKEKIINRILKLIFKKEDAGNYNEHLDICKSYLNRFSKMKSLPLNMRLVFKYFCLPPCFLKWRITGLIFKGASFLG